jgi:hypothetical protein
MTAETPTIEALSTDLELLRAEFNAFKARAAPVIDGHSPHGPDLPLYVPEPPPPFQFVLKNEPAKS